MNYNHLITAKRLKKRNFTYIAHVSKSESVEQTIRFFGEDVISPAYTYFKCKIKGMGGFDEIDAAYNMFVSLGLIVEKQIAHDIDDSYIRLRMKPSDNTPNIETFVKKVQTRINKLNN